MSTIKNDKITKYMDEVCGYIKNKKVHTLIKEELLCHIDEIIQDCLEDGLSEKDAVNKALLQMGDSKIVGLDLNKAHKATSDWILLAITTTLILIGMFAISYISKNSHITSMDVSPSYYLFRTITYLAIALGLWGALLKIDYRKFKKYSLWIYCFSIALIFIAIFMTPAVNGTSGWLAIGPFTINTLHIAPVLFILSLAGFFDNYNWNSKKSLFKGLLLAIIPAILFLLAPSMSTTITYLIGACTVMIISGFKIKYVLMLATSLGLIACAWIFSAAYRIARISAFINPNKDPEGAGWIYGQLASLRDSAGILGKSSEFNTIPIPEPHTDFIFTSIIYCFGWIAGIILIALVLAFIIRIGFIGAETKNTYGKLIISGFCALFTVQFLLSILSNTSFSPILGVSMPFISYGGSQLLMSILSISLINNIYKLRNNNLKAIN